MRGLALRANQQHTLSTRMPALELRRSAVFRSKKQRVDLHSRQMRRVREKLLPTSGEGLNFKEVERLRRLSIRWRAPKADDLAPAFADGLMTAVTRTHPSLIAPTVIVVSTVRH